MVLLRVEGRVSGTSPPAMYAWIFLKTLGLLASAPSTALYAPAASLPLLLASLATPPSACTTASRTLGSESSLSSSSARARGLSMSEPTFSGSVPHTCSTTSSRHTRPCGGDFLLARNSIRSSLMQSRGTQWVNTASNAPCTSGTSLFSLLLPTTCCSSGRTELPNSLRSPSASSPITLSDAVCSCRCPCLRKPLMTDMRSPTSQPGLILGTGPMASMTICIARSCSDHFSSATRDPYSLVFSRFIRSTSSAYSRPSTAPSLAAAGAATGAGVGASPSLGLLVRRYREGTGAAAPVSCSATALSKSLCWAVRSPSSSCCRGGRRSHRCSSTSSAMAASLAALLDPLKTAGRALRISLTG
mmetsp:Transcript_21468/g.48042  ORF Transcript_21468/g.48042 Transcript_21468/m.48042 type:complete len:359 (+) Transcript_21468:423-1499(+)